MSRRALIITCVVSLIVNLGFVGFFVGKSFGPHFHASRTSSWTGVPIERILRPLGQERMQELVPITEAHRERYRERLNELRSAQVELYRATVEEPFDAARLEDAQATFNALFLTAKASHDRMWVEVAAKLRPEERHRIMRRSMPRRFDEDRRSGQRSDDAEIGDSSGD